MPLSWMLVVVATPAVCFCGFLVLVEQEWRSRLSALDICALAAASLPIGPGTILAVWTVKELIIAG
jgi:hypothetical protein